MVYAPSKYLKRLVQVFVSLELLEAMSGYVLLSFLAILIGAFGPVVSEVTLASCIFLSLFEAGSKVTRSYLYSSHFVNLACVDVASTLRWGQRAHWKEGPLTFRGSRKGRPRTCGGGGACRSDSVSDKYYAKRLLERRIYGVRSVVSRFLVLVALMFFLLKLRQEYDKMLAEPKKKGEKEGELKGDESPEVDRGNGNAILVLEFLLPVLTLHISVTFYLLFFSVIVCIAQNVSSMEKVDRCLVWYIHCRRHGGYNEAQAGVDAEACGLPSYWFLFVEELLDVIRLHVGDLSETAPRPPTDGWDRAAERSRSDHPLSMAMAALEELATTRGRTGCGCDVCRSRGDVGKHLRDLPQASRCRIDLDAARDFAEGEGFSAMADVLDTCRTDASGLTAAKQAAGILAGFASALPCLPWQPEHNAFAVNLLSSVAFRRSTEKILDSLFDALIDDDVPLKEAILSAIASFAAAASDLHAHQNAQEVLSSVRQAPQAAAPPAAPAMSAKALCSSLCLRAKTVIRRGSSPAPAAPNISADADSPNRHLVLLSNRYSPACPIGGLLEEVSADFLTSDDVREWVGVVKNAFLNPSRIDVLLMYATDMSSSPAAVDTIIRTLASLWSSRMIYWHRLEKRITPPKGGGGEDPDPRAAAKHLPPPLLKVPESDGSKTRSDVLQMFERLVRTRQHSLSAYSKFYLSSMLVSQHIRGNDTASAIATLLGECLLYWRRAVAGREADWFACEVVETFRDLLLWQDANCPLGSSAVNCLLLMLRRVVTPRDAIWDASLPRPGGDADVYVRCRLHRRTATYDCHRCVAASAGFFADVLDQRASCVSLLLGTPENREHLFHQFNWILSWEQDSEQVLRWIGSFQDRHGRDSKVTLAVVRAFATMLPFCFCVGWAIRVFDKLFPDRSDAVLFAVLGLSFVAALSSKDPRWMFGRSVTHSPHSIAHLESVVGNRLAVKHVLRILRVITGTPPPSIVETYPLVLIFPSMADLIVRPEAYPEIPQFGLLEDAMSECDKDIRSRAMELLRRLLPQAQRFVDGSSSNGPSDRGDHRLLIERIRKSLRDIDRWSPPESAHAGQDAGGGEEGDDSCRAMEAQCGAFEGNEWTCSRGRRPCRGGLSLRND